MEQKSSFAEVELTCEQAIRIRRLFYKDVKPYECYRQLAKKITKLHELIKLAFPGFSKEEALKEIKGWSDNDLMDALEDE